MSGGPASAARRHYHNAAPKVKGRWTPSPLLQRTIDRSALFLFPDCCCGSEILVVCHSKGGTPKGTGTVSRLDPIDGSVMWTADLGIDAESERPRVGYRVAFDSTGAVYVVWMTSSDEDGKALPASYEGSPAGGVAKLAAADGAQLAFIEFGLRHDDIETVAPPEPPRIVVDTAHDRIYATCDYDADGYWLYRLDTSLAIVWGVGPAETDPSTNGRGVGLTLNPANGQVYAVNSQSSEIFRLDPDGSLVGAEADLVQPWGLAFDPVRGLRAGGHITSLGDALTAAYDGSFAFDWQQTLTAYDSTPAGSWNASPTTQINAAVDLGGTLIFGGSATQWDVTAGGTRYASLWFSDTFGNAIHPEATGWGDWTSDAVSSTVWDLAHNRAGGTTYIAGVATGGGAPKLVHRLGVGGWLAPVLIDPTGASAWGIAVRDA